MTYAAAGLATISGGAVSTEAAIHYSGPIDYKFHGVGQSTGQWHSFPLSNGAHLWGGSLHFGFANEFYAYFGLTGAQVSNSLRAVPGYFGVDALPLGSPVSDGSFRFLGQRGIMQGGFCSYPGWTDRGTYYVGFRFNTGAGAQYGWVRIKWGGCRDDYFLVKDYAWGDPGDQVKTGQRQLHEKETPTVAQPAKSAGAAPSTDAQGSLGLLALGAVGLQAWRKSRRGVLSDAP